MPLRQPPRRTPALLARNRANARKSTGPRTLEGKARVRWNALQHGRRAVALARIVDGRGEEARLYHWVLGLILSWFEPPGARAERRAGRLTRLAQQVWCALRAKGRRKILRTKPECLTQSVSYVETSRSRIYFRIDDRQSGRGLTFWTQFAGRRPTRRLTESYPIRAYALAFGGAPGSNRSLTGPEADPGSTRNSLHKEVAKTCLCNGHSAQTIGESLACPPTRVSACVPLETEICHSTAKFF